MRAGLKKAILQNPVLTYRNGIRGRLRWVSKHNLSRPPDGIIVKPLTNQPQEVDAAAIGGRNMQYFDLLTLSLLLQLSNRYLGRSLLLLIGEGEVSRSHSTRGKRAVTARRKAEDSGSGKG